MDKDGQYAYIAMISQFPVGEYEVRYGLQTYLGQLWAAGGE